MTMLPEIEVKEQPTMEYHGYHGTAAPLRFTINGHRFQFSGSVAEVYTLRRDLEQLRDILRAHKLT